MGLAGSGITGRSLSANARKWYMLIPMNSRMNFGAAGHDTAVFIIEGEMKEGERERGKRERGKREREERGRGKRERRGREGKKEVFSRFYFWSSGPSVAPAAGNLFRGYKRAIQIAPGRWQEYRFIKALVTR